MIAINENEIKNVSTKQVTSKIEFIENKTSKKIGVVTSDYDLWLKGFLSDRHFISKLNDIIKKLED
jgi:hypothetical protein